MTPQGKRRLSEAYLLERDRSSAEHVSIHLSQDASPPSRSQLHHNGKWWLMRRLVHSRPERKAPSPYSYQRRPRVSAMTQATHLGIRLFQKRPASCWERRKPKTSPRPSRLQIN